MQRSRFWTLAPEDADADGIAASQKPGAAGNLTLAGTMMDAGKVTFDMPRRIAIASDADDTGRTFTITGVDRNGNVQSEELAGPDTASVTSLKDYGTGPLAVSIDGAATGNITVGTAAALSTPWFIVDRYDNNGIGFQVSKLAGTFAGKIEVTAEEPFPITQGGGNINPKGAPYLTPVALTDYDNLSADAIGSVRNITAIRFTLTNFSSGGSQKFSVAPNSLGRP
jgi:hypothetical protein